MVQSKRIWHYQSCFGFLCPFWLKSDWEITDTLFFNWESICILRRHNKVLPILGHIGLPLNLDCPVSVSVVNNGQVLSHLSSGRDIYFQDGFQGFWLDCETHLVPSDISFCFVVNKDVVTELINRVFTENCERNFVLWIDQLSLGCLAFWIFGNLSFWVFGPVAGGLVWPFVDHDRFFCIYIRIRCNLDCKLLVYEWLGAFLILFFLFSAFSPLQCLNCFLGSGYHIILRVQNILPIHHLVDSQVHWRSDLCRDTWRLNHTDYFVLELSHHLIRKVNHRPRCVKACRNVVQSQRRISVLSDLHIVHFTINCLNLVLLMQRCLIGLVLPSSQVLKNVLCLVCNGKINHLAWCKLVGHINVELNLFVNHTWNVPNPVTDLSCNLRSQVEN